MMISRRRFLVGASAGSLAACIRGPAPRTKQPQVTHGVQAGDVQSDRAIVWARCDALHVELVGIDGKARFAIDLPAS